MRPEHKSMGPPDPVVKWTIVYMCVFVCVHDVCICVYMVLETSMGPQAIEYCNWPLCFWPFLVRFCVSEAIFACLFCSGNPNT